MISHKYFKHILQCRKTDTQSHEYCYFFCTNTRKTLRKKEDFLSLSFNEAWLIIQKDIEHDISTNILRRVFLLDRSILFDI